MSKKLIPIYAAGKLFKENGAIRASNKAKKALKDSLESYATEVAEKAVIFSKHAKRRTIKASDVKLASKTK